MKVTIELKYGPKHEDYVKSSDLDGNIQAQRRAADRASAYETVILMDTLSILLGIQEALREGRR